MLSSTPFGGCAAAASSSSPQNAEPSVAGFYRDSFVTPVIENTSYQEVLPFLLEGRPFVITDGAAGLPMAEWDCDFVRRTFPDSRIRQEGGRSDGNGVPMKANWTTSAKRFALSSRFPQGAPRFRPFYWDIVKAHEDETHRKWGGKPREVARKIVESTSVPYWLPPQSAKAIGGSSEMWFHPPGAGALAHMDPHCFTTVSYCFSGRRKWRMMLPPEEPHRSGYSDGQVYGADDLSRRDEWRPTFELEAPAGSAVIVYPGMVHETLSIGGECSSSISQLFQEPVAAAYFRAFWPRFSLIHEDVGQCGGLVEDMVALGSGTPVPAADELAARRAGAAFAARADADGDGRASEDEIQAIRRAEAGAGELQRTIEELVSFHDVDRDGQVTVREIEDSWAMFATATLRVQRRQRAGEL